MASIFNSKFLNVKKIIFLRVTDTMYGTPKL